MQINRPIFLDPIRRRQRQALRLAAIVFVTFAASVSALYIILP